MKIYLLLTFSESTRYANLLGDYILYLSDHILKSYAKVVLRYVTVMVCWIRAKLTYLMYIFLAAMIPTSIFCKSLSTFYSKTGCDWENWIAYLKFGIPCIRNSVHVAHEILTRGYISPIQKVLSKSHDFRDLRRNPLTDRYRQTSKLARWVFVSSIIMDEYPMGIHPLPITPPPHWNNQF